MPVQALTYAITGGADAALFSIDPTTGALAFVVAPDFEAPTDAGGNNIYDVIVRASDGAGGIDTQAIAVTVTDANENTAPTIISNGGGASASVAIAENTSLVTTVTATDSDLPAQELTYAITGGADAALFSIDPTTGALSFISAPDFEAPTDTGGDNVYDVIVRVSDGAGGNDSQAIAVTITDANENNAPTITSNGGGATATVSITENVAVVTTVTATDADQPAQALSYSIVGGADAGRFTIDVATGALAFAFAPDFELPNDAGGDNVYDVVVQVSDNNGGTDTQSIAVAVTNAAEGSTPISLITPTFQLPAGTNSTNWTAADVTPSGTPVAVTGSGNQATDPDVALISLPTGTAIPSTARAWAQAPTIAANGDVATFSRDGNGNNLADFIAVNGVAVWTEGVNGYNLGPAGPAISADSGTVAFWSDPTPASNDTPFDLVVLDLGQAAQVVATSAFANSSPALSGDGRRVAFTTEAALSPADSNGVQDIYVYDRQLAAFTLASSSASGVGGNGFSVNAAMSDDGRFVAFMSDASNLTPDEPGGLSRDVFVKDLQTGAIERLPLSSQTGFATINSFSNGIAISSDGRYVAAIYSKGVADSPWVGALVYDRQTGSLTQIASNGGQNVLNPTVTSVSVDDLGRVIFLSSNEGIAAGDGGDNGRGDVYRATVENWAPSSLSLSATTVGAGAAAGTVVGTLTATDPTPGETYTYALVNTSGSAIAQTSNGLVIVGDQLQVGAGGMSSSQPDTFAIRVTDSGGQVRYQTFTVTTVQSNAAPVITSNGGGATAAVSVAEGTLAVTDVDATDADLPAQTLTYSIIGGADAALFAIDAATGAVTFLSAPDYDAPADAGADNIYDVVLGWPMEPAVRILKRLR